MKKQPDENRPSPDSKADENSFRGVFALDRLREDFMDLRHNGPNFSHFACIHDICMASIAIFVAFLIVPGGLVGTAAWRAVQVDILVFSGLAMIAFLVFRPYRSLWRYTSLSDLLTIVGVATIVALSYVAIDRVGGRLSVAEWGT